MNTRAMAWESGDDPISNVRHVAAFPVVTLPAAYHRAIKEQGGNFKVMFF